MHKYWRMMLELSMVYLLILFYPLNEVLDLSPYYRYSIDYSIIKRLNFNIDSLSIYNMWITIGIIHNLQVTFAKACIHDNIIMENSK